MTRIGVFFVAGVTFGFGMVAANAVADTFYAPVDVCQFNDPDEDFRPNNDGDLVLYNTSGLEHRVYCGLVRPDAASSTTEDINVYFQDANSLAAMEACVYCAVRNCNPTGSTCTVENTRFGNGLGGETTPTTCTTYEGSGFIQFTDIDRPWNYSTVVSCAIPYDDGSGRSAIERMQYIH